jgi:hypothetical protein
LGKTGDALETYAREIVVADVASATMDATLDNVAEALALRGIGKREISQMMDRLLAAADVGVRRPLPPSR